MRKKQLAQAQSADAALMAENQRLKSLVLDLQQELTEKEVTCAQASHLLQDISNSSPALIVHFNLETLQPLFVSQNAQRVLGINVQKLKNQEQGLRPMFHADDQAHFDSIIEELKVNDLGDTHRAIFKTAAAQGKTKWISCYFYPLNSQTEHNASQMKSVVFYGYDITSQKLRELAESKEREFLKACLENMSDAVVISDPHGNVLMLNKNLKALSLPELSAFELPPEHSITEIDSFAAKSVSTPGVSPLYRVLSGETLSDKLIRVRSAKGSHQIYLACHGAPIKTLEGRSIGAVLNYHDVSDSFLAFRHLNLQNQLSNLLAFNDNALRGTGWAEILNAAVQLLGTELFEIEGQTVLVELWVQGSENEDLKLVSRCITSEAKCAIAAIDENLWATQVNRILGPVAAKSELGIELKAATPNDSGESAQLNQSREGELLRVFSDLCSREQVLTQNLQFKAFQNCTHMRMKSDDSAYASLLIFSEQQFFTDNLIAQTLSNISFQFSSFLMRASASQKILMERDILKNVLTNAPIAIALFDKNLRYVSMSARWISKNPAVKKNEHLDLIGKSFAEKPCRLPLQFEATMAKALLGQTISCDEDHFEATPKETIHCRWAVQPWLVKEQEIGGVVVHFDEINDLVSAREAAFENVRMKSQFVANMSHEVRTPLNGILGMTQLLLETSLSPEQKLYTEAAMASGKSLHRIVNDILDFSKIEAGKLDLCQSLFSIRDSLEEHLASLSILATEKGITLAYFVSKEVPSNLFQDESRILQILGNMIGNAIKFTDSGGVLVNLHVRVKSRQKFLYCEVIDTGTGIAEQFKTKLFQPFSQDQNYRSKKIEGTGLGLSICLELVRLMNGSIGAENNPDRGARFWFDFPLVTRSQGKSQPKPLQVNSSFNQTMVLYFDPDPISSLALEMYLKDLQIPYVRPQSVIQILEQAAELTKQAAEQTKHEEFSKLLTTPKRQTTKVLFLISKSRMIDEAAFRSLLEELQKLITDRCRDALTGELVIMIPFGSKVSLFHENSLKLKVIHTPLSPRVFHELFAEAAPLHLCSIESNEYTQAHRKKELQTHSQARILVAEDNAVNQILVQKYLEKMGFQVDIADNGAAAFDKAQKRHYDLILMDCQMPQLDGFAAAQQIRNWELANRLARTPIVALTAHAFEENRRACLRAGMDAHLSKPIHFQVLQQTINQYLCFPKNRSSNSRKNRSSNSRKLEKESTR